MLSEDCLLGSASGEQLFQVPPRPVTHDTTTTRKIKAVCHGRAGRKQRDHLTNEIKPPAVIKGAKVHHNASDFSSAGSFATRRDKSNGRHP